MTFTYNSPPDNDKDRVRFWSTDTTETAYSVSDEDIVFLLAELDGNVMEAAAVVADRIANYWSTSSSSSGGSVTIGPFHVQADRDGTDMEGAWRDLAARLRAGTSSGLPTFSSGALFTGATEPEFSVGMMDHGFQRFGERRGDRRPANGVW